VSEWNDAIEAAAAIAEATATPEYKGGGMVRMGANMAANSIAARIRRLAKPEAQPSRVEHRGALAFDDDAYCSSEECWCQRMDLIVKAALTGGGK
jgi:hypothetical protein